MRKAEAQSDANKITNVNIDDDKERRSQNETMNGRTQKKARKKIKKWCVALARGDECGRRRGTNCNQRRRDTQRARRTQMLLCTLKNKEYILYTVEMYYIGHHMRVWKKCRPKE